MTNTYSEEIKLIAKPGEIPYAKGLEGIPIGESTKSFVDGLGGRLVYHGHSIEELCEKSSYEEVFYLLLYDRLPKESELKDLGRLMRSYREIPSELYDLIAKQAPRYGVHPMSVMRTAVSALAAYDETTEDDTPSEQCRQSIRIVSKIATIAAAIARARLGKPMLSPRAELSHAGNFYYMLTGSAPDDFYAELMDVLLILHADHECNASTFAAVTVRSTLSDLYSAVVAGICALKGPLHGGANEEVMRMLQAIGSLDNVERFLEDAMSQKLRIHGFGHRVYKIMDPRADILRRQAREVTRRAGTEHWLETAERIEKVMAEKYGQRGIWPNVDFFSGVVMASMGIESPMFTPIFAVGRSAGWTAHALEQWVDNRIFRPRFIYIGPEEEPYTPIRERK
ncbi:MAG: citrate synthase/methylcitrate synthase [Anaerolineales bacterium]|nr:citrate synthase/methylcitrate synthase [Anaerolineales bacterium]